MLDTKTRAPKQQSTPPTRPDTTATTGTPRWFGTALVAVAALVVAAVGYAVYASVTSDGQPEAQFSDSPAQAIVQSQIDADLAVHTAEPSSVDLVNAQIAEDLALFGIDTGPSSVEIVNAEIARSLSEQSSGPDLLAIALQRGAAMDEYYLQGRGNPYAGIGGVEDSIWQATVPTDNGADDQLWELFAADVRTGPSAEEVARIRSEVLQGQWELWHGTTP